jgi:hypothetical protein
MGASCNNDWGFLRKPALFTPAVGFLTFMVIGVVRLPLVSNPSVSNSLGDALIAIPILLVVVTIVALVPMIVGAAGTLFVFTLLPLWLVQLTLVRMIIGGAVGLLVGLPFTHVLNWIPSATAEPRFDNVSMLIACAVAGGYCAFFYLASTPGSPPNTSCMDSSGK